MSALIYCPCPNRDEAARLSAQLLQEKLIACSNILGPIESHYMWEGRLESAQEVAVIFKTDQSLLDQAVSRLGEIHPYDTPAIMGWRCDAAHPATAGWLAAIQTGN